jgi:hypothetical protein
MVNGCLINLGENLPCFQAMATLYSVINDVVTSLARDLCSRADDGRDRRGGRSLSGSFVVPADQEIDRRRDRQEQKDELVGIEQHRPRPRLLWRRRRRNANGSDRRARAYRRRRVGPATARPRRSAFGTDYQEVSALLHTVEPHRLDADA